MSQLASEPVNRLASLAGKPANRQTKKGSILMVVLWSLFLLTSLCVILGYQVRQKLILIQRLDERAKLRLILDSAAKKAAVELKKREEKGYATLNEPWSNNAAAFKEIRIGGGTFSICYDYVNDQSGLLQTRYGLVDENSKLNLNKSELATLEQLIQLVAGLDAVSAQELAAAIVDWRDADSQLSIPLGSAEDSYYRNLPSPYEAKDAEFEVPEELLLVKGINREIFEKLREYTTIYGNGRINANTASKEVFLSLGLSQDLTDKIISFRAGEDRICGTSDDNFFQKTSDIVSQLEGFTAFSEPEMTQLNQVVEQNLAVNSEYFTVRSVAKLDNRKNIAQLYCVINSNGKILSWQES